jgi:hypothetical protein
MNYNNYINLYILSVFNRLLYQKMHNLTSYHALLFHSYETIIELLLKFIQNFIFT